MKENWSRECDDFLEKKSLFAGKYRPSLEGAVARQVRKKSGTKGKEGKG